MEGLSRLAERLSLPRKALLDRTERIVHGTTVATNALLERKGAKVGLLTTEGHRDVLEMREGLKPGRYDVRMPPEPPLVPRELRLGVRERMRADGRVETPLDAKSLAEAIEVLQAQGVTSVAVCYLHAYRDPRHEQATREQLAKSMPDADVTLSSEVFPQIKEYERVSTTVVNAYVGPIVDRYLGRLETRLKENGYHGSVLIILSHGGVAPISEAVRLAAGTVLSGPAGGVSGSRHGAKLIGAGNLIPFDMGGTSSDISLIVDGEPALSANRAIAGQRIALPSLDIVSIGAGGGSIAHVDTGGMLRVGPESAGADPGPACYGRGGTAATVTDASLALGFLDPANFLGGAAQLDQVAADTALDELARELGVDRVHAAEGVHRVVDTQMAEGIRLVSVRRGVDPRRFALLSFGGAAGIHITQVARQLEIDRVVIPRVASVLSAWGMLATDLRYEMSRTHIGDTAALEVDELRRLYDEMEAEGRARLAETFSGEARSVRSADMRYGEQIFEVDVSLHGVNFAADDLLDQVAERFHARHEQLFTYALRDQDTVLVNARVATIGMLPELPGEGVADAAQEVAAPAMRQAYFGEWIEAPVHDLEALVPGHTVDGPAIIESETTTVVLREGDAATATETLWLDVSVGRG
jgi:N-methylhydantoinase A